MPKNKKQFKIIIHQKSKVVLKDSNIMLLEVATFEGDQVSLLKEQYPNCFVFYDESTLVTSVMEMCVGLAHGANTSSDHLVSGYFNFMAKLTRVQLENDPLYLQFHKYWKQDRLRRYKDESYLALLHRMKDRYTRYVKAYCLRNEKLPPKVISKLEILNWYLRGINERVRFSYND